MVRLETAAGDCGSRRSGANLTDPTGGDAMDRIINGLSKVAPKA
ncbi:hypothetical protein [Streptomyces sp. NBC_00893]|nr:hypothetical protein [Streptomyces sp. NBC_00893]MCX4846078.1 hypothetical protein [Streptomyces sp. NBC_00893]